mmetsp:Transcript_12503/g.15517  ORF Transcript_12503/g.15517 Transcript_12503/m.15517 type:complete len:89 (-) Transcript_12503:297-563(-)
MLFFLPCPNARVGIVNVLLMTSIETDRTALLRCFVALNSFRIRFLVVLLLQPDLETDDANTSESELEPSAPVFSSVSAGTYEYEQILV